MKIAILGTRGIPNYYSGFEQFAEYNSVFLAQKGHEVYCYNSHNHQFQEDNYKGEFVVDRGVMQYRYKSSNPLQGKTGGSSRFGTANT